MEENGRKFKFTKDREVVKQIRDRGQMRDRGGPWKLAWLESLRRNSLRTEVKSEDTKSVIRFFLDNCGNATAVVNAGWKKSSLWCWLSARGGGRGYFWSHELPKSLGMVDRHDWHALALRGAKTPYH